MGQEIQRLAAGHGWRARSAPLCEAPLEHGQRPIHRGENESIGNVVLIDQSQKLNLDNHTTKSDT